MCMQCVTTGVVAAGATATGLRAWLNIHKPAWATPRRMKAVTAAILTLGVLAAGVSTSPASSAQSGPPAAHRDAG